MMLKKHKCKKIFILIYFFKKNIFKTPDTPSHTHGNPRDSK